jgi:GNAT superfamily N-acetyltransferase
MTVSLRAMTDEQLGPWLESVRTEYVESRMLAGETREQALDNAGRSFERAFEAGRPRPGHLIFLVVADDTPIGHLWLGPQAPPAPNAWWVWEVVIEEPYRRRGYGRQAMLLGEAEVRQRGGTVLGLNVFGFNTGARALYESLGYETTAVQMLKDLAAAD